MYRPVRDARFLGLEVLVMEHLSISLLGLYRHGSCLQ